ncbi:MAG TPA: type II toxin-antitoxin system Phd/YefM family antitoxin [Solirubrobacteraceae bacterium]|nr:type II toxin-antitoxin system Phd/YefM family antitoxin [Solirubrobacteraceae bacterium]
MSRTISASQFKARCLAMLDEVAETGDEIVITKRGRPVARVTAATAPASLRGSVTLNESDEDLLQPVGISWHATSS